MLGTQPIGRRARPRLWLPVEGHGRRPVRRAGQAQHQGRCRCSPRGEESPHAEQDVLDSRATALMLHTCPVITIAEPAAGATTPVNSDRPALSNTCHRTASSPETPSSLLLRSLVGNMLQRARQPLRRASRQQITHKRRHKALHLKNPGEEESSCGHTSRSGNGGVRRGAAVPGTGAGPPTVQQHGPAPLFPTAPVPRRVRRRAAGRCPGCPDP